MAGERLPFNPWRHIFSPSGGQGERRGGGSAVSDEPRLVETPTRESPLPLRKETRETSEELQRSLKEVFRVFDRFAPPPTAEEVKAANNGEYRGSTRTVERYGGNGWVRKSLASAAVGSIGGYVLYHEVPAVHSLVDSYFLSHLRGGSTTEASEVPITESSPVETLQPIEEFDNTAVRGVVKESMIKRLPQEEINRLYPTAFGKLREDGDNNVTNIAQPISELERAKQPGVNIPDLKFEIREDKGTIQLQYPLDLSQSSNPNAEISFRRSYGGFTATDRLASFQDMGYYDSLVFQDVPKGAVIQAPLDGFLTISRTNGVKHDPEHVKSAFIDFQAPNGNIYRIFIGGVKGNDISVLTPLLDAPNFDPEQNHMPVGSFGIPVRKGQPLFQSDKDLDSVGFKVMMAIKGNVGEPPEMITQPFVPTTIELLSHEDKLLASSN